MRNKATPFRMIDGHRHELGMWLVLEKRADGIPLVMRLCQDGETVGESLEAASMDPATAKPEYQLLWTPAKWLVKERA